MARELRYCIIKKMTIAGKELNIIMLDGGSQVLEFDDKTEALELAELLEINSDSGWQYTVKDI